MGPGKRTRNVENKRRILDYNSGMAHRVHFSYWQNGGVWFYRFIGEGLTPLGPVRKTRSPEVVRSLAERGGGLPNLEAKLMLDLGVKTGNGGMYLSLTDEQYDRLCHGQISSFNQRFD